MTVVAETPDPEIIHFPGFQSFQFHVAAMREVLSGAPGFLLHRIPLTVLDFKAGVTFYFARFQDHRARDLAVRCFYLRGGRYRSLIGNFRDRFLGRNSKIDGLAKARLWPNVLN